MAGDFESLWCTLRSTGLIETNGNVYLAITDKDYNARSEASQRCKDIYVEGGSLHLLVFETLQEMTDLQAQLGRIFGKDMLNHYEVIKVWNHMYDKIHYPMFVHDKTVCVCVGGIEQFKQFKIMIIYGYEFIWRDGPLMIRGGSGLLTNS